MSTPSRLFPEHPDDYKPEEFDWGAWDAGSNFDQNIVNIVLLGFDKSEAREDQYSAFRTDSIKVISINLDKEKASIINIPRDIYVKIADTSTMDKINHAYYYGFRYGKGDDPHKTGLEYSLKSISYALGGIPLRYYVTVDMDSVVALVDSIGGVEFTVEDDVYFKGKIWVKEGHQILDGKRYLRYLRSREGGGDIGRVNRQTELLMATLDHFKKQGLFTQVPALYHAYGDYVDTNLTAKQIVSLALYARNLKSEDIRTYTLSGFNQSRDGVYYMVMNQAKRSKIIKEVFGIEFPEQPQEQLTDTTPKPPRSFTIDYLQNAAGQRGFLLTWEPGDRYNITYNIYRRVNSGDEILLAEGLGEDKFWDIEVKTGHVYYYRLEAVNRRVVSGSIQLQKEVAEERPAKPVNFKASVEGAQVILTWKAGSDKTTGFRLIRKGEAGQEVLLLNNVWALEYLESELPEGQYTYRLTDVNTGGMFSDPVTLKITIEGAPEPEEPGDSETP